MPTLTDEMLARLRELAQSDGLDPELAELALSSDAEIPAGVLETLTGIMDGLAGKSESPKPGEDDQN